MMQPSYKPRIVPYEIVFWETSIMDHQLEDSPERTLGLATLTRGNCGLVIGEVPRNNYTTTSYGA
jgi:hypothetical protein